MCSPVAAVGGAVLVAVTLTPFSMQTTRQIQQDEQIQVVIRGKLEFAAERVFIVSRGARFRLEFPKPAPSQAELKRVAERPVVVRGSLEPQASGEQFVCKVEGQIRAAGEASEVGLLVAYDKGRSQDVEALIKELGLVVRTHNKTGGYFKVVVDERNADEHRQRLEKGAGVRFVEVEQVYRTQSSNMP